ncbi:MAG: DUF4347 domain-containing protein, partial [Planctomycetota bacterium]
MKLHWLSFGKSWLLFLARRLGIRLPARKPSRRRRELPRLTLLEARLTPAMDLTSIRELVIVDGSLRESAHFSQPPRPETRMEFLDQNRDGVRQITDILQQYRQLDAIQIYSHGASGQLRLGSSILSNDTIGAYADDL